MTTKGSKLSREEFKQKQDLEAARKAGTIPAEVDLLTGRDINPHIPQYIAQTPWYLDQGVPTLIHQRPQKREVRKEDQEDWYLRGARKGDRVTKFRKGACENCGAMTHKAKDCLERPRKLGAKITGMEIQPDEIIQTFEFSFDGKRDRYNGYDNNSYLKHIQEWEKVEEKRKAIRAKELEMNLSSECSDETKEDEDKYADEADMAGQKVDLKTRTTIRNLRIREDTAKYLRNLDTNSAYYDPKTRSMRGNPYPNRDPKELDYAGDNLVRYTGEAKKMIELQNFCWDANEKGVELNLQANPTQAELMTKIFLEKKGAQKEDLKHSILEKYGGAEYLESLPKELIFAQTEKYVEYSRNGQLIKGEKPRLARSRYEEDVYLNNHTSVWGSYWEAGLWGYACCQQFIKGSYCTGKAGIEARRMSERQMKSQPEKKEEVTSKEDPKSLLQKEKEKEPEEDWKEGRKGEERKEERSRKKDQGNQEGDDERHPSKKMKQIP